MIVIGSWSGGDVTDPEPPSVRPGAAAQTYLTDPGGQANGILAKGK